MMKRKKVAIPTLMLHGICSRHVPLDLYTESERFYTIRDAEFQRIVDHLSEAGLRSTNFDCPWDAMGDTAGQVCITFDDAYLSHYISALPILLEFNMTAVFFVTVGEIGRKGRLSWAHLRSMAESGMSIQSHTVSHRPLDRLRPRDVLRELGDSKAILEDATGREVNMLSLPGGRGGRGVEQLAREAGYTRIFGSKPGATAASGRGEVRRHVVSTVDPVANSLAYVFASPMSAVRDWARAASVAAAKDVLGEGIYNYLKSRTVRRAGRSSVAERAT